MRLLAQRFAQSSGNVLRSASPIIVRMRKPLVQVVAENVKAAFVASRFTSERALAREAGVAPNSVKNLMHPERRAPNARGDVAPRLDVLEKIARSMGYEAWQLMVQSFDPNEPFDRPLTKREAEVYRQIEQAYQKLPPRKERK